ncbi:MAG: hypothetical protein K0S09_2216 [Sphingobacteriaceae bacterium]|jgi:hypothetical protein|nr:hypothetical protein [Sphingobacteriaceae bacterium]
MKRILFVALLLCIAFNSFSQDFDFGKVTREELQLSSYSKDTTANAVVLKEFGTAAISSEAPFPLIFEHHVRIKIFNKKAFEHGNIIIPVYKSDTQNMETVSHINGITFTTKADGSIAKTPLELKKVYKENKNRYWDLVKFAMPNLTDGCIIEYKYQIESPFKFNFRKWVFQWDIPKVYSEYVAMIPSVYEYNVTLIGLLKIGNTKSEVAQDCFNGGNGFTADCSKMTYSMSDIPALVEEDYMTAASNYRSAINFELAQYYDYRGGKHAVTKDWKDIDYDLKRGVEFGGQMKKTDLFKTVLPSITKGSNDELTKAKAVYAYTQKWFKWNNIHTYSSDDGIKKAMESHSGSVADINLSLIAALSAAGLNTEAVLLSTRENGVINKVYPVVSDFNYVVAKVNIGDKSYLLDATDPLLPFGLLPIRCINDQGRVISSEKPSYWIDMVAQQRESSSYNLDLTLGEDGKISGTIICYSNGYEAYNKRKAIKKFNSTEEYVESLDERMPKIKILNSSFGSLDSLDQTLSEKYEVQIDAYDDLNTDRFSFNPFFIDPVKENPFKLKERSYPVDWGAPSDTRMTLILRYPAKFEIQSKPDAVGLALPLEGGKYSVNSSSEENKLSFSQLVSLNKSIYQPNEYPYIKELFNKIVETQKSEIVFKKKL